MPEATRANAAVVVAGDVTLDWNIARRRRELVAHPGWSGDDQARACPGPGGAALLGEIIATVAAARPRGGTAWTVHRVGIPTGATDPCAGAITHSYAQWAPFRDPAGDGERWRVETFLGLDPQHNHAGERRPVRQPDTRRSRPGIVVLDDADLGYRDAAGLWEPLLAEARAQRAWIVLKMAHPIAHGGLWERLVHEHAERLITVVTMEDLRRTAVQVSRQISWEQTAEDLTWELTHNAPANGLSRCAHAVVSLDTAGALLLAASAKLPADAHLLFDPEFMEGEWAARFRGGMIGNTATLTAAIVHELMERPLAPDITSATRRGIRAMRRLLVHGYDADPPAAPLIRYPLERVAADLCAGDAGDERLAVASVQPPLRARQADKRRQAGPPWTILGDAHRGGLGELAVGIVRSGLRDTIADAPVARFAKLSSVDRREIEALRSIRALIAEYCDRRETRPLSIAVFGPPGAGKSFAVKQVTASVRPGAIAEVAFNLSQLDGPAGLLAAFHKVRDASLRGHTPLVFWDEFDASLGGIPLGWLRYFLAPMQDGEFLDGQVSHPTGRAIFVFAGGTAVRLDDLGGTMTEQDRRDAKLPDFVSRLKGVLEVLGPDPRGRSVEADPFFVVRRAILLRSLIEQSAPALVRDGALRIDDGVLRAFLQVSRYAHGARSLESLVAMSQLSGCTAFVRSALPPESQLALHVDPNEFLAHVHRPELSGMLLEDLAVAFHEHLCAQLRSAGYRAAAKTDDKAKTHSSLKPFARLPADEQDQNRSVVRDLPRKLALRGYVMMPNRRDMPLFSFSKEDVEVLAGEEHRRWMDQKLRNGWRWGKRTDKETRLHADLVPFERLSRKERDKDSQQVRDIPRVLATIGYTIVRAAASG